MAAEEAYSVAVVVVVAFSDVGHSLFHSLCISFCVHTRTIKHEDKDKGFSVFEPIAHLAKKKK